MNDKETLAHYVRQIAQMTEAQAGLWQEIERRGQRIDELEKRVKELEALLKQ